MSCALHRGEISFFQNLAQEGYKSSKASITDPRVYDMALKQIHGNVGHLLHSSSLYTNIMLDFVRLMKHTDICNVLLETVTETSSFYRTQRCEILLIIPYDGNGSRLRKTVHVKHTSEYEQ
jgi:hypothetical protein